MIVGDRVLCKSDYSWDKSDNIFNNGEYYTIVGMRYTDDYENHYGKRIWEDIKDKEFIPSEWVEVMGKGGYVRHFSLIKMEDFNYFYDYFKDIRELRREKLEKLGSRL